MGSLSMFENVKQVNVAGERLAHRNRFVRSRDSIVYDETHSVLNALELAT
jgi:hypothetical protein